MNDTYKVGRSFVFYKGNEYNKGEIVSELDCPQYYSVKHYVKDDMIFAKVVDSSCIGDREPYYASSEDVITLSWYDLNEIEYLANLYFIDNEDLYHLAIRGTYSTYGKDVFKELSSLHFCSVIYDKVNDKLIAGVTTPNNEFNHLYYGYTPNNKELMISNDKSFLDKFCYVVNNFPNNTYMKNGKLYTLYGRVYRDCTVYQNQNDIHTNNEEKCSKGESMELIHNTKENADSLIKGLNILLGQITDESVRETVEKNVNDYLSSSDVKERLNNYVSGELNAEIKNQIIDIINSTLEEYDLKNSVSIKLQDLFDSKLEEYSKANIIPVKHIIKLNDTVLGQTSGGFYHEKFGQILSQVQLDEPIMLIGPAGSGKNVAISQVASALGKDMYYTNNASNEFKLTGFIDAGGNYRETEFYKAFKNGGVFFLDEIDNSDPSALIVINSALANGYMAFPHETIDRHPDFRIIAAANTWGKGSDLQYVGRNVLDAATLDRFDNIYFDYDKKLEKALYPNDEVLEFMWAFRDAVYKTKIPHIVSTRGIGKVYKKEINNIPVIDTLTSNVVKNLKQDDVNTIIGNMEDVSINNKYYSGIKTLKLGR